jgi:competence protein ComEC
MKTLRKIDTVSAMFVIALFALAVFLVKSIVAFNAIDIAHIYFLNVTQGDSALIIFPGGEKMMIDAGSDSSVVAQLEMVLPANDGYINIAVISDPSPDSFAGYNAVLDHYRIGAFIYNGRANTSQSVVWLALIAKMKVKNIPLITLGAGDHIHFGTDESEILSPDPMFALSPDVNDTGLVELIQTTGWRALFTAQIGMNVENYLLEAYAHNVANGLSADVLKIARHGSQYASEADFLRAVGPRFAVIEGSATVAGKKPAGATLARIASSTHATILQTGKKGVTNPIRL